MNKENYNVIGVMSGTSLDGIDIAHITFENIDSKWKFKIHEAETFKYPENWIIKLKNAVGYSNQELTELNEAYTEYLGNEIKKFISKNSIKNIDAVCSHGHTVLHQPQNGYTLQIGNLPKIADVLNITTVCDFRVQDVKMGGQGAPLVPIGDQLLFSDYDYCLNLGGFSNISFTEKKERIAFDISPVNTVLNYYANKMGMDYDDKGKISKSGKINLKLLEELNALQYYTKTPPKSLGIEFVKTVILPVIEKYSISTEDKMCTFTEHIAIQISIALTKKEGKLLVSGGGSYNDFLIERMRFHLTEMKIIIPDEKTIEYKEALIFGLLGVLKLRNEVNCLSSVTGAVKNHSSGVVYIK